jgi:uncharacterized protein (DUF1800 family)
MDIRPSGPSPLAMSGGVRFAIQSTRARPELAAAGLKPLSDPGPGGPPAGRVAASCWRRHDALSREASLRTALAFQCLRRVRRTGAIGIVLLGLSGSADAATRTDISTTDLMLLNRVTWGATPADVEIISREGSTKWLERQLQMSSATPLPRAVQQQINQMQITKTPMVELVAALDAIRRTFRAEVDPKRKREAQKAYQRTLRRLGAEAQARAVMRFLYSPAQLLEKMTWFWFNHFNVQASKREIDAMVGDFEERAIRPHALGRFRDLLEATLRHPAMLRYLDNDQNAAGHLNENYAREIMELHSMGERSGYTQGDVRELARILTGVGLNLEPNAPKLKPEQQALYIRTGLFEFNPARHDFGDKELLGHRIMGSGLGEVEQALDIIARAPATGHHVSLRLATYFVGDTPPPKLVNRMTATFMQSDGDVAAVLRTLFKAPEFRSSLGTAFKDPVEYVISAVRLALEEDVVVNPAPVMNWLTQMGEGLYANATPDGYPLISAAWIGPGQMSDRFDVAKQIASLARPVLRSGPGNSTRPAPRAPEATFGRLIVVAPISPKTRAVLDQAVSSDEWNTLYISSPEFMRH